MQPGEWDDREWDRLVEQVRNGDCTPLLGAGASVPTLPTSADMAGVWAEHYGYPFGGHPDLPEVMHYASVVERSSDAVKQRVARDLASRGEPPYAVPGEPHSLLAGSPIRVYLTTKYDDFMTRALQRAGKRPVTAVCPWYGGADNDPQTTIPGDYQPGSDEPLVYHLHGSIRADASLVLTDRDHIEFLMVATREGGRDGRRIIPTQVVSALIRQPLLFVGYSLQDWSFRMLVHGLIEAVVGVQRRRHVSIQLGPDPAMDEDAHRRAESFLSRYAANLNMSIYWGDAGDFCTELAHRLGAA